MAISIAILAEAYAACQREPFPRKVESSLDMPHAFLNANPIERAIEADEAASALESLLDVNLRTRSAENVRVETEIFSDDLDLRRSDISVDGETC